MQLHTPDNEVAVSGLSAGSLMSPETIHSVEFWLLLLWDHKWYPTKKWQKLGSSLKIIPRNHKSGRGESLPYSSTNPVFATSVRHLEKDCAFHCIRF